MNFVDIMRLIAILNLIWWLPLESVMGLKLACYYFVAGLNNLGF